MLSSVYSFQLRFFFSCGATLPFQQCVGRLVLWPVCMPQSGLESRHKVLLSCGVIPNDGGALCGFLVCLSHMFLLRVSGNFYCLSKQLAPS